MRGLIVKGIAGFYYVKTEAGLIECKARGIFKKEGVKPMVGDEVSIEVQPDGGAVIHAISERRNSFIRPPVANVDCFVIVVSASKPEPNYLIIDRFLVMAEKCRTDAMICISKADAAQPEKIENIRKIYEKVYPVVLTSGVTGEGLAELEPLLRGKKCALAGPSGMGKSTLLNALCEPAGAETGSLSRKTERGKHTTRHAEIFETDFGAWIFDTPGFTSFEVLDADLEELQHCYPEIENNIGGCRYSNCSHITEPDCAVLKAVKAGDIHASRYHSYVSLYKEIQEKQEY